jgi:hypothetical protein
VIVEVKMSKDRPSWSVPVRLNDVPSTGRRFDLRADQAVRATVARAAAVAGIASLEAGFEVMRHGVDGLHVVGQVAAAVEQTCVVTLEPMTTWIEEGIDLLFEGGTPAAAVDPVGSEDGGGERPEPLVDGTVDLGAVAVEFLMLGIDPYPRKPGAVFHAPVSERGDPGPFAALAALKKKRGGATG